MRQLICFGVRLVSVFSIVLSTTPLSATDFSELLQRYTLTTWSTRDGLPAGAILAVVQSADGFLWLASREGLVRFDGSSFEMDTTVPRATVRALCAARDGSLWVGYGPEGGIARVRDSVATRYHTADGVGPGTLSAIIEDGQGQVWVGDADGLRRFVGDRFVKVAAGEGLPEGEGVTSLSLDRVGHLMVGTHRAVYRWQTASRQFAEAAPGASAARVQGLGEDGNGQVWVADGVTGFRRLGSSADFRPAVRARGVRVLRDRQGGIWVSTTGDGLWRIEPRHLGPSETVARAPVSGGRSLYEDRDGNIWVGTIDGLARLSERRMPQLSNLGPVSSIEATPDGHLWIASANGLFRFGMSESVWQDQPRAVADRPVRATHVARDGTLWMADTMGLWRRRQARLVPVAAPPPVVATAVTALTTSPDGGVLWVALSRGGLVRWIPDHEEAAQAVPALGNTRLRSLFADARGRVWLTSEAGRLGVLQNLDTVQWFDSRDGLGVSTSFTFLENRNGVIWVAGPEGLWGYKAGRFQAMMPAHHAHWSVPTLVEDAEGDLWLGTAYGIAWVKQAEVARWLENSSYKVHYSLFDASDGLAGLPGPWGGRTSVRSADGDLWIVTGRGITRVSPPVLKRQRPPVPVRIARVTVDGQEVAFASTQSIESGATQLVIDYRALELRPPRRCSSGIGSRGSTPTGSRSAAAGRRSIAIYPRATIASSYPPATPTAPGATPLCYGRSQSRRPSTRRRSSSHCCLRASSWRCGRSGSCGCGEAASNSPRCSPSVCD